MRRGGGGIVLWFYFLTYRSDGVRGRVEEGRGERGKEPSPPYFLLVAADCGGWWTAIFLVARSSLKRARILWYI